MSSNKMVIVPQELLDKIGESRRALYAMYPHCIEDIGTLTLHEMVAITDPMWVLANTKWEEYKNT